MPSGTERRGLRGHRIQNPEVAEDKRRALLIAAARVFARRGYWTTSLDQVADELGWTKGAIYYYFASKEELFAEIQSRSLVEALDRLDQAIEQGGPPHSVLRRAIATQVQDVLEGLDQYAVLLTEAHVLSEEHRLEMRTLQRRYEQAMQRIITAGIEAGELVPGNPKLMTFTLLRGSLGVADWYDPEGSWTTDEIITEVTNQLMRGVFMPQLIRDLGLDRPETTESSEGE